MSQTASLTTSLKEKEDEYWNLLPFVVPLLHEMNFISPKISDPLVKFELPEVLTNLTDFSLKEVEGKQFDCNDIIDICRGILKYSVRTSHPNFHNQLFGGVDPLGLAASWVTEALHTSQYTYEVGPALTLVESACIQKCLNLFGFPNGDGIFAPGGSISNMYAMVCARHSVNPEIRTKGLSGMKTLVAYTSEDSHYSLNKASNWLGIGIENLILIKADNQGVMITSELEKAILVSLEEGKQPFFVNATGGTTLLGAFDDITGIADVCDKYKLWLHVDACLGGAAIFCPGYKHLLNGVSRASSFAWNPHKSLGAPLQCSMFLVKECGLLHTCNSANAKYLFQQDKFYDVSYDTGDKSVQCSRKVDAFKFWLMFKVRGESGFAELVSNVMHHAKYLASLIEQRAGFHLIMPHFQYTNICFWYVPKRLRNLPETPNWWEEIFKIPPIIKAKMINEMMITYAPIPARNIGNFFRMNLTCHPPPTEEAMVQILDVIDHYGANL